MRRSAVRAGSWPVDVYVEALARLRASGEGVGLVDVPLLLRRGSDGRFHHPSAFSDCVSGVVVAVDLAELVGVPRAWCDCGSWMTTPAGSLVVQAAYLVGVERALDGVLSDDGGWADVFFAWQALQFPCPGLEVWFADVKRRFDRVVTGLVATKGLSELWRVLAVWAATFSVTPGHGGALNAWAGRVSRFEQDGARAWEAEFDGHLAEQLACSPLMSGVVEPVRGSFAEFWCQVSGVRVRDAFVVAAPVLVFDGFGCSGGVFACVDGVSEVEVELAVSYRRHTGCGYSEALVFAKSVLADQSSNR